MDFNDNIPIKVFGSRDVYSDIDARDEPRVAQIIRDRLLSDTEKEYHRVNVKIRRNYDETPNYLVVYLLRKDVYSAEVVKIDLDDSFAVTDISRDYDDSDEEDDEEEDYSEELYAYRDPPDGYEEDAGEEYGYDFVVATPVPEISTAKEAVNTIYNFAKQAGLNPKKLLGTEASVANYKLYLKSGLRGFVNIGHGSPTSIVLADGALHANWFNGLSGSPLKPCVVYFNSCKVCNTPLKEAVMKAGTRTYIGGIVNLLIGPSEKVCKCFWQNAFKNTQTMKPILKTCETNHYPNQGSHGFIGEDSLFMQSNLRLAHAMWVHGHSMEVEYPERVASTRRIGPFMRTKGKPFTGNWYHFAVPTTVILDGKRPYVGSVMLRFRVGPGAFINNVHIYDGEYRIASHDNLHLAPQGKFLFRRFDVPKHPKIKWGLGISIGVKFGDSANLPPATRLLVDISAVGCDFMVKPITIKPIAVPAIIEDGIVRVPETLLPQPSFENGELTNGTHVATEEGEIDLTPSLN